MTDRKTRSGVTVELNPDGIYYQEQPRVRRVGRPRTPGGLYVSIPFGFGSYTIDHFLVDPPEMWQTDLPRPISLISDGHAVNHVVATVDVDVYPFVPDLVEEARTQGISIRVPVDFDLSRVTNGKSGLVLVHQRGFTDIHPRQEEWMQSCSLLRCLWYGEPCAFHHEVAEDHRALEVARWVCLGNAWLASTLAFAGNAHRPVSTVRKGPAALEVKVTTPSSRYAVEVPESFFREQPPVHYSPAVVMRFPMFYLEFVSPEGTLPEISDGR